MPGSFLLFPLLAEGLVKADLSKSSLFDIPSTTMNL